MPEGQPVSMTDHLQAGDPPIDDEPTAAKPPSVATPAADSNGKIFDLRSLPLYFVPPWTGCIDKI